MKIMTATRETEIEAVVQHTGAAAGGGAASRVRSVRRNGVVLFGFTYTGNWFL